MVQFSTRATWTLEQENIPTVFVKTEITLSETTNLNFHYAQLKEVVLITS